MMCEYDSKLIKLVVDDTPKAIFGLLIVSFIFIWTSGWGLYTNTFVPRDS